MARNFRKYVLSMIAAALLIPSLGACERKQAWHETDITGSLPPLEFAMTRASDGAKVTGETYRGNVVALYFGFTNCPGPCPLTMANMADVLAKLGPDARKVRVLFVTVDLARDDLNSLRDFTAHFGAQVDGLRGDPDALARLARRYRVAYSAAAGPSGVPVVTHSNAVFVFDETGRARLLASDTSDTKGIASDFEQLISNAHHTS
jgi:protein SCO1/2